ncbi:MAG: hypothetical protein IK083_06195 [Abditibacteriota bacterium]|nr:hypothetical protein [Abditibacteriota bacterium]
MKNKAGEIWLSLGKTAKREKQYEKAIGYFKNAGDYPGAEDEIKECNYLIACGKVAVKDFASARTMFRNMGDYRDSGKKYMRIAFRGIKKGSVVQFGTYQQKTDSDTYGPEPIEWIVLAIKANKALLLSRYALEYRQYNSEKEAVTWEDCSMRDWLNDEFYNTAFNETEKKYISLSYSVTPGNAKYKTYGGKPVQDQVFLLSFEEAKQYLPTPANRLCKPTEYAAKRNVDINQRGTCPWWLRTPGAPSVAQEPGNAVDSAMFVDILGTVIVEGCFVNSSDQNGNVGDLGTARPAIWVLINY